MRLSVLPGALLCVAILGICVPGNARAKEDAVYVYDLFREANDCAELFARLRQLPLRPTVILSVEQGPEFVLDRPNGETHLTCALRFLRGSSRKVKALFLQDPIFLERSEEAVRRAALLGDYVARHPREFSGAQVDVEPHAGEKWEESNTDGRRRLLQNFHELLRQVRPELQGLPLSTAIPWWYPEVTQQFPQAAPQALFGVADELYLMVYGDAATPKPWNTAALRLAQIGGVKLFSGIGPIHLVLATYEFRSPAHLKGELKKLRRALASKPNFAGTALFHATSGFSAAPLGPFSSPKPPAGPRGALRGPVKED